MVAGALFSANYFGGDVEVEAEKLFHSVNFGGAISNGALPSIHTAVNDDGNFASATTPFNDYVIMAGLAKRQDPTWFTHRAVDYFEKFVGTNGAPSGISSNGYPSYVNYKGHQTLSSRAGVFTQTSAIQLPFFTLKDFHTNPFYKQISRSWLEGKIVTNNKELKSVLKPNCLTGLILIPTQINQCGRAMADRQTFTVAYLERTEDLQSEIHTQCRK